MQTKMIINIFTSPAVVCLFLRVECSFSLSLSMLLRCEPIWAVLNVKLRGLSPESLQVTPLLTYEPIDYTYKYIMIIIISTFLLLVSQVL